MNRITIAEDEAFITARRAASDAQEHFLMHTETGKEDHLNDALIEAMQQADAALIVCIDAYCARCVAQALKRELTPPAHNAVPFRPLQEATPSDAASFPPA